MDAKSSVYRFANFELNVITHKLYDFSTETVLTVVNRQFTLLKILCENSPQPVSRQHLCDILWPNTEVTDSSLSRLISDTRKLLSDDGENQALIKTERGVGFVLNDVVAIADDAASLTDATHSFSVQKGSVKFWLAVGSLCLLIIVAAYLMNMKRKAQLYSDMTQIAQFQDNTYTAFLAQVNRRNELAQMIEKRLNIKRREQFEKFFAKHHNDFTAEEQFVCEQMRAITDTGLKQNNQAIFDTLTANPEIFNQIEQAKALQQHLRFWLDKYNSVYQKREDMCLLYVGVEDNVPYPSGVDQKVKQWLKDHK